MTAYVEIELDTTPPEISFIGINRFAGSIGLAYEITEPRVIAADFIPDGHSAMPMVIAQSSLWVFDVPYPYGIVVVTGRDDVWNSTTAIAEVRMQEVGLAPRTGDVLEATVGMVRETTSRTSRGQGFERAVIQGHRKIVRHMAQTRRVWSKGQEKRP